MAAGQYVLSADLYNARFCVSELPWDQPAESCQEYCDWNEKKLYLTPWKKIEPIPLSEEIIWNLPCGQSSFENSLWEGEVAERFGAMLGVGCCSGRTHGSCVHRQWDYSPIAET